MIVLVVEGAIGAGKSTLLQVLSESFSQKYKVVTITEPVDLWLDTGALQDFYSDIKGKAYEFQTFAFATRIQKVAKVFKENPDADIYIIERSPYSDRYIFMQMMEDAGYLTENQKIKYKIWWETWMELWPFLPTHFIHLNPGLTACLQRVQARSRDGESQVDSQYEKDLIDQHRTFFLSHCPHPTLNLDTDIDFRTQEGKAEIVDKVTQFLNL